MDNPETLATLGTQDEDKQIKISFHCGFCTCTLISSNQSTVSTECSLLIGQFSSMSTEKLQVCKGSGMFILITSFPYACVNTSFVNTVELVPSNT
jgi:hypothetical protein